MSERALIIAEAGVNHNGSLEIAYRLVDEAKNAGADVVKFQSFIASELATTSADMAEYQIENSGKKRSQYDMLKELELSFDYQIKLVEYCKVNEIEFLSTAFEFKSLEFLKKHGNLQRLKIPSGEISNAPLILEMSRLGLPIILSTGTATVADIERALSVLAFGFGNIDNEVRPSPENLLAAYVSKAGQDALRKNVTILHCSTAYPVKFDNINLRAMKQLGETFGLKYGYSDHSEGEAISIAAAALGASVIEKHFTLDKNMEGPDHKASLNPQQLCSMIRSVREVESALGTKQKIPSLVELQNAAVARKSLVSRGPIKKGELFTVENLGIKRPGTGKSPFHFWEMLGKPADRDYCPDELI